MHPLVINGRSYRLDRLQHSLPTIDLISWLASSPLYPKVFWREQDSQITRASVGNLLLFPNIPQFSDLNPVDVRLYGGVRFGENQKNDLTWSGFPNTCFWLPQIELSQENDQTQAVIYSLNEPASMDTLHSIREVNQVPAANYTLIDRSETPSYKDWQKTVETVLESISDGQIDKLVLARKTTLQFANPLSPWPLLAHLNEKAKRSTLFAFQLTPSLCFVGATPEKLFHRQGTLFNTAAVAATRPRGKTVEEDLKFEKELLTNVKEQREFRIVKDYLDSVLSHLSEKKSWDSPECILKASHVQHLYHRCSAQLKTTISDADLIRALHPTPALGGYPRNFALKLLDQIESFDRGWYGAPIGMIGQNESSLYVAIRSALIQERKLHLFAGTGLVQGSIAEHEWEELEQKIRPFTELFF